MKHHLFTDLELYKACRRLRKDIAKLVGTNFPKDEKFRLADQIIRASRSVTACIAEGYGRFYYKENVAFCRKARGSLSETLEHLITAYDANYISHEILVTYKTQIDLCNKLLNGYISYHQKAKPEKEIVE